MNDRLDLNLIAAFDALLREGSVTRAAEHMGVTQSAMSHSLRRLRAFFNDPLFIKVGDRMRPTPRAEDLTSSVCSIMTTVRTEVLSQTRFDPLHSTQTFTLCLSDMGELSLLPPLFERLRILAPNCSIRTLRVPLQHIEATLESGEADLAIGSLISVAEGLYQQELFTHPFVTLVSANNQEVGERITLEQFCGMKHVVVSLSGSISGAYDRALDEAGIKRDIILITPHFLVVPFILEKQAQCVATVPRELGTVFQNYNLVRVLDPPIQIPRFQLRQHWHPRVHYDEANIWLRKLIKVTFDDYPGYT
ncbi:MAG: LysR family transcriptional regulator [Aquisalimonadaceae bacterium]